MALTDLPNLEEKYILHLSRQGTVIEFICIKKEVKCKLQERCHNKALSFLAVT